MQAGELHKIVPEIKLGSIKIEHFEVDRHGSVMSHIAAPGFGVSPGRYVRLYIGNSLMMSDTRMEVISNCHVVQEAHGRCLIAGLGIGLILFPILEKPEVSEVLVILLRPPDISIRVRNCD